MKRIALARILIGALALVIGYGFSGMAGSAGAAVSPPTSPLAGITVPHSLGSGRLPPLNTSNSTVAGSQQAELYAIDGLAGGQAGFSVSVSGSVAAVGAPGETANGNVDQGVVYVFAKSGTTWHLQAVLTSSDGAASDAFGNNLALSGTTLVVGAPDKYINGIPDDGASYVFTESGGVWAQTAELTAPDGTTDGHFGSSEAISGSTIVVGDPARFLNPSFQGSVYVFNKSGSSWLQKAEIISPDLNDAFGDSVAVAGSTIVVGVPGRTEDSLADPQQGEADIFALTNGTWKQTGAFVAPDGATGDELGFSVSISGSTVVAGSPFHAADRGSAYVLIKSGTVWKEQAELTGADSAAGDWFGYSVSLSGNTLVAGAPLRSMQTNTDQGAAYVFTRSGTIWKQAAQLLANDGAAGDVLGASVSDSGTTALVGAPGHGIGSNGLQGAAYVFAS